MKLALTNVTDVPSLTTVLIDGEDVTNVEAIDIRLDARNGLQELVLRAFKDRHSTLEWFRITSLSIDIEMEEGA